MLISDLTSLPLQVMITSQNETNEHGKINLARLQKTLIQILSRLSATRASHAFILDNTELMVWLLRHLSEMNVVRDKIKKKEEANFNC